MFEKILIANRGEIACRIIHSCKRMGIRTIAVFSSIDRNSLHVDLADQSVRLGASPPSASYSNIEAIIGAAQLSGADAVHPGYGFLSENADFAEACARAGIVFIGPSSRLIRALGSKEEAKRVISSMDLPVLPGKKIPSDHDVGLESYAKEIGLPIIVKPEFGGGGRGIRVVRKIKELAGAIASARNEARLSFPSEELLIEKYLEPARHIEVQVLGDNFGNVVHLFERDCSFQRRHQKLIEETLAPNLSNEIRVRLYHCAVTAAKEMAYTGAGTVEFLVDQNEKFWFTEMNPRLQVEHAVSEMITGIDLVEWQIRVAAGEALSFKQPEIKRAGHAIEARVCAEDPADEFLPGLGVLSHCLLPKATNLLRIETGVAEGDEITVHYDSMIAKIIAHGDDRISAINNLYAALESVQIAGPATNENFLKSVLKNKTFVEGRVTTQAFDTFVYDFLHFDDAPPESLFALLAFAELVRLSQTTNSSPWSSTIGWRPNSLSAISIELVKDGEALKYSLTPEGLWLDGACLDVNGEWSSPIAFNGTFNGSNFDLEIIRTNSSYTIFSDNRRHIINCVSQLQLVNQTGVQNDSLVAGMPGVVIAIYVDVGQEVSAGTPLMAVEAMKVEHIVRAPSDGKVSFHHFKVGDRVTEGEKLLSFEGQ